MPLMGALLSLPQKFSKGRLHRDPQPTWVVTLFLNKYDSTKANTRFKEVLLAELRNIYMSHDNPKTDPLHGKREEL